MARLRSANSSETRGRRHEAGDTRPETLDTRPETVAICLLSLVSRLMSLVSPLVARLLSVPSHSAEGGVHDRHTTANGHAQPTRQPRPARGALVLPVHQPMAGW